MKPVLTLFIKEFRQHGVFAPAMVVLCLLFQVTCCEGARWMNYPPVEPEMYLFIAMIVTALYAGAAAALAYSTEHADNTFVFLRKLPISTTTIALGKIGWVICGTVLVLLCNSLLAAAWILPGGGNGGNVPLAFGVSIIEMLIWGLFWSTRCRSQVHAMIAAFICASFTAWFIGEGIGVPNANDITGKYLAAVPYRLCFIAIIALFALWGALRWFDSDTKISRFSWFAENFTFFRYPQKVQPSFLALVYQHILHASILYPLGIASFVFCSFLALSLFFGGSEFAKSPSVFIQVSLLITPSTVMGLILLFWGNIFGHDQRHDSYRFLSRLGIHEGKIWWSRMLPALLAYLLVFLCSFVVLWADNTMSQGDQFVFMLAYWFSCWLAPLAMGAFFSISFRSQMVAIALTMCGSFALCCWMMIFQFLFGCSPLWTTVPVALSLLIASRLRAKYWLRETFTWRSRLIPLLPCFAVILAIFVALPLVRIYSIPYVSWEQIAYYFDTADLQARRAPEKRNALLQYIAAHGTVPLEYKSILANKHNWRHTPFPKGFTYEEYLLLEYADERQYANWFFTGHFPHNFSMESAKNDPLFYARYLPWERVREERALRMSLVAALVLSTNSVHWCWDVNAMKLVYLQRKMLGSLAVFDERHRYAHYSDVLQGSAWNRQPLDIASRAVAQWYREHKTFPESLDELVGTYLVTLPVHPWTDEPVRYYVNSPPPSSDRYYSYSFCDLLGKKDQTRDRNKAKDVFLKNGGTYLMLGKYVFVLVEPAEDDQDD